MKHTKWRNNFMLRNQVKSKTQSLPMRKTSRTRRILMNFSANKLGLWSSSDKTHFPKFFTDSDSSWPPLPHSIIISQFRQIFWNQIQNGFARIWVLQVVFDWDYDCNDAKQRLKGNGWKLLKGWGLFVKFQSFFKGKKIEFLRWVWCKVLRLLCMIVV